MERGRVYVLGVEEENPPIAQILRSAGYAVTCSQKIPKQLPPPQIALIAGGMQILDTCRRARSAWPSVHLIACVAADEPAAGEALAAGADELMIMMPPRVALLARIRAAMAHVGVKAQLERERRATELLEEITNALADADLADGLNEIVVRVGDAFGFNRCAVLVLVGDNPDMIHLVAASDEPSLSRLPVDLNKYPEMRASIERQEPVFIDDSAQSPLLGEHAHAASQSGSRSLLVMPLLVGARVIGVLQLRSTEGRRPLDKQELRLLTLVSRMLAASMRGRLDIWREQTRRVALAEYRQEGRRRALEQYRDFFESAADGMVVVDAAGRVLYVNRAAEQLTGYARSGLAGRTIQEIVDEAQRAGLSDVLAQAAHGAQLQSFDLQLITTSGEPLRVSVSTSHVLAEHEAVVLSFRDVTLARALEEELRKTKDFLERLIDSTVDAIIAADIRGRVMIFNRGAERLIGYSAEEVIGKLPVWKLYPQGEARVIMAQLRSPEHGGKGTLLPSRREVVTKDGVLVPVSLTASIIYEDGREVASVGIVSDLRERLGIEKRLQQAQEKLQLTEKQALIADLAGTTAHELNQPLTSVMGYTELLKKRMSPDDPNVRAVDIILREAERMAVIVRKIGKITRYETKAYVGSTTILDLDKSATES